MKSWNRVCERQGLGRAGAEGCPVLQVLYRTGSQGRVNVLTTDTTTAELWLQLKDDYFIEVRATTEGGDGSSSEQILIPRLASRSNHFPLSQLVFACLSDGGGKIILILRRRVVIR